MEQKIRNQIKKEIPENSYAVIKDLESEIKKYLDKCGLFYKVFSRIKSPKSIIDKIEDRERRNELNYKIQDLVGIRIVLYFKSDIQLCEKLIKQHFTVLNISKDDEEPDKFKAQRINYVCRLPEKIRMNFNERVWEFPIDTSFEIQIRTIFSEGWHEIEHDFRYKSLSDWKDCDDFSRTLNGIFATLENCDWAIESLFAQLTHKHYKNSSWIPMLKNTFKVRITNIDGMDEIVEYFNGNKEVAKAFYRMDREEFLLWLSDIKVDIPLNLKNLVCLVNIHQVRDEYIEGITPGVLKNLIQGDN